MRQYGGEDYWVRDLETTWQIVNDYTLRHTYTDDDGNPKEVHENLTELWMDNPAHPEFKAIVVDDERVPDRGDRRRLRPSAEPLTK